MNTKFFETMFSTGQYSYILQGIGNTIIIALGAAVFGVILGSMVAIIRVSADTIKSKGVSGVILKILDKICAIYLAVFRGTPMVIQLMIMYYIIFAASKNALLVAIIAFGINSGAYVSEIVRGGILSVDKGQTEAGRSLGLSYTKTMFKIVFPQALKTILPSLGNEFITLFKETSIAGYVGIHDITKGADIIRGNTYDAYSSLIAAAVLYFIAVAMLTFLLRKLERRLRRSDYR